MRLWTFPVFASLLAGATAFGAEPQQSFPDTEIQEFLVATGMSSIKVDEHAPLQTRYEEVWFGWCRHTLLEPMGVRLAKLDGPARAKVLEMAASGIKLLKNFKVRDYSFTSAQLAEQCDLLIKAGVDDPLIHWLQCWSVYDSTLDFGRADELFQSCYKDGRLKKLPALRLELLMTRENFRADALRSTPDRSYDMPFVDAIRDSIADGSFREEDEEVLVENAASLLTTEIVGAHSKAAGELLKSPKLSKWCQLMLTGIIEHGRAWGLRKQERAPDADPDKAKDDFEDHIAQSRTAYREAAQMHPERPRAATAMLGITYTKHGEPQDNARAWFDAAVAARFDYMPAYRYYLSSVRPGRGGAVEQELAFGLACVQTHRFDTEVPYFFFDLLRSVLSDTRDWQTVFDIPVVAKTAIALARQKVQDAPTPKERETALAALGMFAFASHDYQTAVEAFGKLPGKFPRSMITLANAIGGDAWKLRGKAVIFQAGLEQDWGFAEAAREAKDLDAAMTGYELILPKVTGLGAALVKAKVAGIRFERDFPKGDWVQLPVSPGLPGWEVMKGDWEGTSEGVLVQHGAGTSAHIVFQGRIGAEFQMRGEFEIKPAGPKASFGAVVSFVAHDQNSYERFTGCALDRYRNGCNANIMDRRYNTTIQERWIGDDISHGTFLITGHNKNLTFAVNGRNVFTDLQPYSADSSHTTIRLREESQVGFGHYMFERGDEMRVSKVEVRMIQPGEELKAPAPHKAADVATQTADSVTTPEALLQYLEGSVWNLSLTKEGPLDAEITLFCNRRNFRSYKKKGGREPHAMTARDARSFFVDGEEHLVQFSADCTTFEISNWPEKNKTSYGTLKSLPKVYKAGPDKAYDFADSQWRIGDVTLDFRPDGTWKEENGKKTTEGKWRRQSVDEAVVFIRNGDHRRFIVSVDGKFLAEGDKTWEWYSPNDPDPS